MGIYPNVTSSSSGGERGQNPIVPSQSYFDLDENLTRELFQVKLKEENFSFKIHEAYFMRCTVFGGFELPCGMQIMVNR